MPGPFQHYSKKPLAGISRIRLGREVRHKTTQKAGHRGLHSKAGTSKAPRSDLQIVRVDTVNAYTQLTYTGSEPWQGECAFHDEV
jgi:N-acyl-D-aspartate/D-glutamate deacylase